MPANGRRVAGEILHGRVRREERKWNGTERRLQADDPVASTVLMSIKWRKMRMNKKRTRLLMDDTALLRLVFRFENF